MKQLRIILRELKGQKIHSIILCRGPIACISIELDTLYLDIATSTDSRIPYQIVTKDDETVKDRTEQMKRNPNWSYLLNRTIE